MSSIFRKNEGEALNEPEIEILIYIMRGGVKCESKTDY